MRYEVFVAGRYLARSRLQTGLIFTGVGLGILIYTFMAALINGVQDSITRDVIGSIPHVTLEEPDREPRILMEVPSELLVARRREGDHRRSIGQWRKLVGIVKSTPGVTSVSPEVVGGGFLRRGETIAPVSVVGVLPENIDAIAEISANLVRGDPLLGPNDILIGIGIADRLGLWEGQTVGLQGETGVTRSVIVRGIFDLGNEEVNERLVHVGLSTGQQLMGLPGRVSQIRTKVALIYDADVIADRLHGATGLQATSWIRQNPRFRDALVAQGRTSTVIKAFSLAIVVISVASALLLSVVRRQAEIGIMRSMGIPRSSIVLMFVSQGFIIGLAGSLLGALLGWTFCEVLLALMRRPDGTVLLPVDPAQGEYGTAIVLATLGSILAAILPARQAANVDPVEAISP
jgi:lipoprotein-releasing system permease protein